MAPPARSIGRGLFRLVLRFYPSAFRARFGDAMLSAFDEKRQARRLRGGRRAAASFAVGALANAAYHGLAERRHNGRSGRRGGTPRWIPRLIPDLRMAARALVKSPGYTVTATMVLALGIGVSTSVFSVLDSVLLRPVPYADADRLATLLAHNEQGRFSMKGFFTSRVVAEWRNQTDLFTAVEAYETATFVHDDSRGADLLTGAFITPGLLGLLGTLPETGRPFVAGEGREGALPVVIVSHRFARRRLGGPASAVGTAVVLDATRYQVVGVMPATFRFPDGRHEVWLPYDVTDPPRQADGGIRSDASDVNEELRGSLVPIVRRRPDVPAEVAAEQVRKRGLAVRQAAGGDDTLSARVTPFLAGPDDRTGRSLVVLAVAVGCLLLIVCANVAGLTVARTAARAPERATRTALGASPGALVREALIEHGLIGVVGAGAGLALATIIMRAVVDRLPEEVTTASLNAIDIDGRAMAFLAGTALVSMLAVAVPAAVLSSRSSIAEALGRRSRASSGSSRRLRTTLVVVEVCLSVILVTGATLMTRSLLRLQAIDTGIQTEGLIAVRLGLPAGGFDDVGARRTFLADLVARLDAQPDIVAASAGQLPTEHSMVAFGPLQFADRPDPPTKPTMMVAYDAWPGYFEAAGIRLVEGRGFSGDDPEGAIVVSEGFARRHWPERSALGMRFRVGKSDWRTVVGVANEVRRYTEDDDTAEFELYFPHDQLSGVMYGVRPVSRIAEFVTAIVRTDDVDGVLGRLSGIVHDVDARVVVSETSVVAREMAEEIARPRLVFLMMGVFAAGALLLAAAGLYGLLAHVVAERRREIGIRMALGASPRDVGRSVVWNGFVLVAAGLVAGLGAAVLLVDGMRSLLYEVDPSDPGTTAMVAALIAVTGLAAVWRPARQAMRVDPVVLLRTE